MKKIMTVTAMLVFAISMFAKDIKTVVFTTLPQMHCENCENKIKGNLRFEKGIKQITTSVPDQKVTIEYDADKTTPENIAKGFAKIGYEATVVTGEAKKKAVVAAARKLMLLKATAARRTVKRKKAVAARKLRQSKVTAARRTAKRKKATAARKLK